MKTWTRMTTVILAFAALSAGSAPALLWADDGDVRPQKTGTAKTSDEQQEKARILAEKYQVRQEEVLRLRTRDKLGWGEISHLCAIAQKSGQTPDDLLKLRQSGMGWGEIAHKYNLNLGEITRDVHADRHAFREHERKERGERMEHRRMERMENRENHMERSELHGSGRPERVATGR